MKTIKICLNLLTFPLNALKIVKIYLNLLKFVEICWFLLKNLWNFLKLAQINWNLPKKSKKRATVDSLQSKFNQNYTLRLARAIHPAKIAPVALPI